MPVPSILPPSWDPKRAADAVLERLIPVTAPSVKGAHDSHLALVGDRAYVVAEVNDVRPGENPAWPEIYVALAIVHLGSLRVEAILPVAQSEQAFENVTLPVGACFVPRIIARDHATLRCFFASERPGLRQSQIWYRDFSLHSQRFAERIRKAKLQTSAGIFDMQPQHFFQDAVAHGFRKPSKDYGLYLFDMLQENDGPAYVALNNYPAGQNALAVANDALDVFHILGHYNEPQELQLSESAINRLPDGTWMAICRQDGGNCNYTFATSTDGKRWTHGEHRDWLRHGTNAKPTFDRFHGLYYLGWQESTRINKVDRSVFNVSVSRDAARWELKYRFETDRSFQYPTFQAHNGAIYLSVTQGDPGIGGKVRIMFGMLEELEPPS